MKPEEQILQLQRQIDELKQTIYKGKFSNLQVFDSPVIFRSGWSTGAQGTFGVYGVTPIAQRNHVANPSGGATTDTEARTAINSILSTLEAYGFHKTS